VRLDHLLSKEKLGLIFSTLFSFEGLNSQICTLKTAQCKENVKMGSSNYYITILRI